MLDFVTRRRLIVCALAVFFVIISLLFIVHLKSTISNRFVHTLSSSSNISTDKNQQISTCYLSEPTDVITLCQKCTTYEQRSNAVGCSPTGYREFVVCSKSNIKTYRSCSVPSHIQKQQFWLFEGFIFVLGALAFASVYSRQKILDKQMVEKIKKQIEISEE